MTKARKKPNSLPRQKASTVSTSVTSVTTQVKLIRTVPEYVPLQYTDGLMIQQKDTMFHLSFLQTQYPLVVTPAEIREIKEVEQRCVAQLIISPDQMAKNLRVLNKSFNDFIEVQHTENQKHLKDLLNGEDNAEENS